MADGQERDNVSEDRETKKKSELEQLRSLEEKIKGLKRRVRDVTEDVTDEGQNRIILKLGTRVKELETQLEDERRRHADTQLLIQRTERNIRELTEEVELNRKSKERLQNLVTTLETRSETLQNLAQEAEQSASEVLGKYDTQRQQHQEDKPWP